MQTTRQILSILDKCCDAYTFPMLDNGYVYLAGTRLSLYRSSLDWAMVIEVFGFSPRSELPDTHLYTFASRLYDRDRPENYVSGEAFQRYLANNPNNESRFVYPVDEGSWQDPDDPEVVAEGEAQMFVRGIEVPLPGAERYALYGIDLEDPPRVQVFEACRYLSSTKRDLVLATPEERRRSVPPEVPQMLQIEEWAHPDVVNGERPSESETFRQLAEVIASGDPNIFRPTRPPNTHWQNWPEGGLL